MAQKSPLTGLGGVYRIECTANGRQYIGKTKNLGRRKGEHTISLRNGTHRNKAMQADYNLYGKDAFEFTIIASGINDEIMLDKIEADEIEKAGGVDGGICYNVFSGGSSGWKTNATFREAASKRFSNVKWSEERKKKASENTKKQWQDTEYRELMTQSAKNQWKSEEYRSIMHDAHSGKSTACGHILTEQDVIDARRRKTAGESTKSLAEEFGVAVPTMISAINGTTWKFIN